VPRAPSLGPATLCRSRAIANMPVRVCGGQSRAAGHESPPAV
jgi:hypothetical protein